MTLALTHSKVSAKGDGVDPTLIQPSDWNAGHSLTCATGVVLGNNSGSAGAVTELSFSALATAMGCLLGSGNLSAVASPATARTNLGLGTGAVANITVSGSAPSGGNNGDVWIT